MTPDKETMRRRNREQYLKHREDRIAKAKAYWRENKAAISERNRLARQDPVTGPLIREKDRLNRQRLDPSKRKASSRSGHQAARFRKHGMSADDYSQLLELQGDRCGICLRPFEGVPRIDHDHVTGEVRGLLCHSCNVALGHFRDSQELLRAAIRYLEGGDHGREWARLVEEARAA